jgi:hypothetical protein
MLPCDRDQLERIKALVATLEPTHPKTTMVEIDSRLVRWLIQRLEEEAAFDPSGGQAVVSRNLPATIWDECGLPVGES